MTDKAPSKLNASQAGKLLGLSPKTLRKRLRANYRGPDRIQGAVRAGRDWLIPAAEVERLIERQRGLYKESDARVAAFLVMFSEWKQIRAASQTRLINAARNYGNGKGEGVVQELQDAIRERDEFEVLTKFLLGLRRSAVAAAVASASPENAAVPDMLSTEAGFVATIDKYIGVLGGPPPSTPAGQRKRKAKSV